MNDVSNKISTKEILQVLAVGGLIVGTLAIPSLPMAISYAVKQWKNVNKKELGRTFKRLERQKMISITEKGSKIEIILTEKGKQRLVEYSFENIQLKARKRDGKWRLIIFDIPEDKKSSRDVFRRKLMQLGFIRVQDSVFASAFPCKNEVDFLCHYLEISDYVTIATVDKIERGEQLLFKEYFNHE